MITPVDFLPNMRELRADMELDPIGRLPLILHLNIPVSTSNKILIRDAGI